MPHLVEQLHILNVLTGNDENNLNDRESMVYDLRHLAGILDIRKKAVRNFYSLLIKFIVT